MELGTRKSVRVRGAKQKNEDDLIEDPYDPTYVIRRVTGLEEREFATLRYLELKVNVFEIPIHKIGEVCPCVQEFNLTGSVLESLRDLGTTWYTLRVLRVCGTGISNFEGITSFTCIKELYANNNLVAELSALLFHDTLEVIDLANNRLSEYAELSYLTTINTLLALNLSANPVTQLTDYAIFIQKELPMATAVLTALEPTATLSTEPSQPTLPLLKPVSRTKKLSDDIYSGSVINIVRNSRKQRLLGITPDHSFLI